MKTNVIKFVVDNQELLFNSFVSFIEKREFGEKLDLDEALNEKMVELELAMNTIDESLENETSSARRELFDKRMQLQRQYMLLMDSDWLQEVGLRVDEEGNVHKI